MIQPSDPRTRVMGDMLLKFAVEHKMTPTEIGETLVWLQLFMFTDAAGGSVDGGILLMQSGVVEALERLKLQRAEVLARKLAN